MQDFSYVYWIHILFVGPLLIYLGVMKQDVPDIVFNTVLGLGVIVILYHGYKLYNYLQMKKS
jgi:hypothetical protein